MTDKKAKKLRLMMEKAATSLTDTEALTAIELYPKWEINHAYIATERIRYEAKLYRCEQSHTSQTGWEPAITPALWTEVAEPGTIPVWKQPTGAQDSYMTGDKVYYPDKNSDIWICQIDYNVYAPDVYGWIKEV